MTFGRLLVRNLAFHWRGNLAVLLGVAVGTAVLTGALLVGDSLRGSLRDQVTEQLGWVDQALIAGRFVRAELARQLDADRVAPAIMVRGAATKTAKATNDVRRAGQVMIIGVDERFWPADFRPADEEFWESAKEKVILNRALANELGAQPGETVTLHLQKTSAVPRESLLGRRDAAEVVDALKLTVKGILANERLGRFNVRPSLEIPRNAFVPLRMLQKALQQPGRVNAFLAQGESAPLQEALRQHLTLDDWGLILNEPKDRAGRSRGYLSLESRQLLLEPAVVAAAQEAAEQVGLQTAPTLVYLANSIADASGEIPYSVVAALDPDLEPPLGPFLPPGVKSLADDEIVLVDWKESPLKARPGAAITLKYFKPEDEGRLPEVSATFKLKGVIPLEGAANDPHLTPDFPGITDKLTIRDWNPPFPFDNKRVQKRDEQYWDEYRTTPKAYITLPAGQRLWGSRFGRLTSIRLAPREGTGRQATSLPQASDNFAKLLLAKLRPEQGGLVFDPVRERGLEASVGGTDFGMYFFYFSFFLIVSALLLVGLLFRLNLDRRGAEIGVLLAAGFRRAVVRRLLLAEGCILAALGGLVGSLGASLYAWLLLELLRAWWPGALERSFLRLHATPLSFIWGYGGALLASVLTILWAVRVLGRVSPRSLLAGATTAETDGAVPSQPRAWSRWLALGTGLAALALVMAGRFVHDQEGQAMTFFGSGSLLLVASLMGVWAWLRGSRHRQLVGHGGHDLARLGVRNAARHPVRSLLTVALLAAAVFVVVAVESFHRAATPDALGAKTGTGGFTLLAESNVPLYQDLNSDDGRAELNFPDAAAATLRDVRVFSFRYRAGEDASCLNLYQPSRPQLLGVPDSVIQLNRFRFQDSEARSPQEQDNPWKLLESTSDGAIPAIGDATTVKYILKKKLGDIVQIPNERGESAPLRIVGLLADSIFQSQLLVSEANFLRLYPNHEGYQFFLIDAPAERGAAVKALLETTLAERGFEVTATTSRLEAYWAVEDTYLSTFQALGGLGLVLGALGLAVVLLRTVWERRGELALLRALGFRHSALGQLMLWENSFLLGLGVVVGTVAALVAVLPHLGSTGGSVPLLRLLVLVAMVLAAGLGAGAAAVAVSLRAPLIPALRQE
jgi:ABC-type lipoprotein release transport system permease subunit